jgi:hypothetical protein
VSVSATSCELVTLRVRVCVFFSAGICGSCLLPVWMNGGTCMVREYVSCETMFVPCV